MSLQIRVPEIIGALLAVPIIRQSNRTLRFRLLFQKSFHMLEKRRTWELWRCDL